MATPAIIRRFRKELREWDEIQAEATITLDDDPLRSANTQAARMLLEEALHGRITVTIAHGGIVCGSREEAATHRLKEYTQQDFVASRMLLSEVPAADLNAYLQKHGVSASVYVPENAEQAFVDRLSSEFSDITYGL